MTDSFWHPTASIENMRLRATIYAKIRRFFAEREVLEVDTPIMSHCAVSDPHLYSVPALYQEIGSTKTQTCYLQTSPEYPMKRLLAAGCPSMYQLCKVFRNGESGQFHNPEFTMLEWYRLGWNDQQLRNEVDELFQLVLNTEPADSLSYEEVFLKYVSINPHHATIEELQQCAERYEIALVSEIDRNDRDMWLQLLMSEVIERKIGQLRPIFIYDFPSSQAALARVNRHKPEVAARFEAYFKGIELVNGFYELADATEQSKRFDGDLAIRSKLNLTLPPRDERFLAALGSGLFPDCAGVALGVDRLIMLTAGAENINEVISFPFSVA